MHICGYLFSGFIIQHGSWYWLISTSFLINVVVQLTTVDTLRVVTYVIEAFESWCSRLPAGHQDSICRGAQQHGPNKQTILLLLMNTSLVTHNRFGVLQIRDMKISQFSWAQLQSGTWVSLLVRVRERQPSKESNYLLWAVQTSF